MPSSQKVIGRLAKGPLVGPWPAKVRASTRFGAHIVYNWVPEGSLAGFVVGRKSVILGVWAAPGARESLQKCGGRSFSHFVHPFSYLSIFLAFFHFFIFVPFVPLFPPLFSLFKVSGPRRSRILFEGASF